MMKAAISCGSAAAQVSAFLDGILPADEQGQMDAHLDSCAECSHRLRQFRQVKSSLRNMPVRVPPASLRTRLRIVASREIVRHRTRATVPAMFSDWRTSFRLWFENLMRPLAIPTAGGFVAAVALFCFLPVGMASPNLALSVANLEDVPTVLYTDATVKSTHPVVFSDEDVVVDLVIDDQGRILSYNIPDCPHIQRFPSLRRNIESSLLFTQFTPATTFGQPMSGKLRLSFRNSSIIVKG